ncbi:MAG: hypothetical protein K2X32_02220 [Phycisphaerales bacterium]|nr:hypothetical protein [Phycisphaerales bacterium]
MTLDRLHIAPAPSQWLPALGSAAMRPPELSPDAARFRAQLGLPVDRPVIFSGHQASIWHAGILAKYLLAHEVASGIGGCAAWLVVDTDAEDFTTLAVPSRDAGGVISRRTQRIASTRIGEQINAGVPPASLAPFETPASTDASTGIAPVDSGLALISVAIERARLITASAGEQIASATLSLIEPVAPRCAVVMASRIGSTDLFQRIAMDMARSPERWARGYNDAIAGSPDAHLTPLRITPASASSAGVVELPLWHLPGVNQPRQRVYAAQLPALLRDGACLAPKALLLTGLLRAAGCELFIHGLGGAGADGLSGYDAATARWMGAMGLTLAPAISCSATLTLPLLPGPRVTPAEVARLRWKAHAARHNPGLVLDALGAQQKLEALERLKHASSPLTRRAAFSALHQTLADHRHRAAPALEDLNARANAAALRVSQQQIAGDRTFPFPLHDLGALRELRAQIAAALRDTAVAAAPSLPRAGG